MMTKTTTITLVDDNGNDDDDVASTTKTKPIMIDWLRNICQTFLKHSHGVYVIFAWNFTRAFLSVNFE